MMWLALAAGMGLAFLLWALVEGWGFALMAEAVTRGGR
jgi:hypothetical protein